MHLLTFSAPLSPGPALPGLGLGPGPPGLGPFLPGGPGLGWKRSRHFPCSSPRLLTHRVCSGQSEVLLQGVGAGGLQTPSVHELPLTQSLSVAQLGRHIPRFSREFIISGISGISGISMSSGISGFGVQVVSAGQRGLGSLVLQRLGGGTLWQAPSRHACAKRQSLVTLHPLKQILHVPFLISAQTSAFGQSASDPHRIGPWC